MDDPDKNYPCDELVASQWWDRTLPCFTDVPERRLLVAVLTDAIRCLEGAGRARSEVVSWVRGEKAAARIPFQSLCESLGMEAAPLGRRLLYPAIRGRRLHRRVRVQAQSGRSKRIVKTKSRNQPHAVERSIATVSSAAAFPWPDVA
jgi:hypothetical protein